MVALVLPRHGRRRWPIIASAVTCMALGSAVASVSGADAAAPVPCNNALQITDASGDGHHISTDVTAGWFSEAGGTLQGVIRIRSAQWAPEHDDAEHNVGGYALLFTLAGQTRYVRGQAPPAGTGPIVYDYGTWTGGGNFVSAGSTTGSVETGINGTMTIDVPAALGATAGVRLANPFILTYDGVSGGVPDWVDHAPGGVDPNEAAYGADYVVGSCGTTTTPGTTTPGTTTPTPGPGGVLTTTAVLLKAAKTLKGGGTAKVTGSVTPARGGVAVTLSRRGKATVTSKLTTAADGTFSASIPIKETTELRAVAEGVGSQTLTVTVRSTIRITLKRLKGGGVQVTGTVKPALPGKVLWLRSTSAEPSVTKTITSSSRFSFRLKHPRRGRYQAVYVPSGERAERSTSNTGVIR